MCEKERRRKRPTTNWSDTSEIINIAEHLNIKYSDDQFLNIDKVMKAINQIWIQQLNQSNENSGTKKEGTPHITAKLGESLKETWESKIMHGQYPRSVDRQLISKEDVFLCLSRGDLKRNTES
jgi:hypothetical protein